VGKNYISKFSVLFQTIAGPGNKTISKSRFTDVLTQLNISKTAPKYLSDDGFLTYNSEILGSFKEKEMNFEDFSSHPAIFEIINA